MIEIRSNERKVITNSYNDIFKLISFHKVDKFMQCYRTKLICGRS